MTNQTPAESSGPHAVDLHVGARIRLRRRQLGMSQEVLASKINLTFQQVQKYERGANRVSASMMFGISQALGVSIQYFFDGYGDEDSASELATLVRERDVNEFLMSPEGIMLAETFPRIASAKLRRRTLELVRTLAEVESGEG